MGAFKDTYDIARDILAVAKKKGYQDIVSQIMEIQAKLFEFKEENETLKDNNKILERTNNKQLAEIKSLQNITVENSKLRNEITTLQQELKNIRDSEPELLFENKTVFIKIARRTSAYETQDEVVSLTLDEIFKKISLKLKSPNFDIDNIFSVLHPYGDYIYQRDVLPILSQFEALGLICTGTYSKKETLTTYVLTNKGNIVSQKLNAIKQKGEYV